ncbi:MFS transporter [Sphingobacterium sp. DK4209]|uniref:MFS transporter n=1 Tax=Sphingobacterium zhuxiongii TaxID=2662364 RepID=A0A5Q0QA92_9SPHI|nr:MULTISPECIES: MFS transporter [unclassified Sphingobacterium]MVZ64699.1 MFS transporter [Sphingobacterium sp. DK4209]QGA27037.1 MFS transporter [Sphingobacterium sp. dk4302]
MSFSFVTKGPPSKFRSWLIVGLLFIIAMLNYIDRTMITTMRTSIVDSIPMSDAEFGLLTAVFLWVYGFFSPFAGYLADRYSRSRVILFSLFVWSLVTWMTSYASTFNELLITRALMGISEACYIPAALALIMDYHKGPTRSLATGVHMAGIMLGQSLGFVGGWLAENHTWNYAFTIFGIFGMCYALAMIFLIKDVPKAAITADSNTVPKVRFVDSLKVLISNRSFLFIVAFFGFISIVGWLIVGWLPTYFQEKFSLTQTQAGVYSTGYVFTAAIFGVLFGGMVTDIWSKKNSKARIYMPFIGLCIAAPAIFMANYSYILSISILCFILYSFCKSFVDTNTMPILSMVVEEKYRATGYGILNFCGTLVGGLGLYFGGALRDSNIDLHTIFQFASGMIILSAVSLLFIKPNQKLVNAQK